MRWIAILLMVLVACAQAPVEKETPQENTNAIDETIAEAESGMQEAAELEEEMQIGTEEQAKVENTEKELAAVEEQTMAGNAIVELETNKGKIKIELFEDKAPKTTANFKKLVEQGFYDGTSFHRVISNFMIQGGDPTGTGMGGPGYTIDDEFGPGLKHDHAGILSMANAGPNTGGSQFFITLAQTPWLDGKHAIFGEVVGGMDVVSDIGSVATGPGDKPVQEVKIIKARVV